MKRLVYCDPYDGMLWKNYKKAPELTGLNNNRLHGKKKRKMRSDAV